jgi:hypothetical protein
MSKGKHKDYAKVHRERYNNRFKARYGMEHKDWAKWKKTATKEEIHERRERAKLK